MIVVHELSETLPSRELSTAMTEKVVELLVTLRLDGDFAWPLEQSWALFASGIYRFGAWRSVWLEIGST